MRELVIVLSSVLTLVCVGGCIPIGVRGSTMARADVSPQIARPAPDSPHPATHQGLRASAENDART